MHSLLCARCTHAGTAGARTSDRVHDREPPIRCPVPVVLGSALCGSLALYIGNRATGKRESCTDITNQRMQ